MKLYEIEEQEQLEIDRNKLKTCGNCKHQGKCNSCTSTTGELNPSKWESK